MNRALAVLALSLWAAGAVAQDEPGRRRDRPHEEAYRMVSAAVVGTNLGAEPVLNDEMLGRLEEPIREAVLTMNDGLHLAATTGAELYIGGTQRLTSVWEDLSAVQRILEVLAREAEVMSILAVASGTSIQIGAELPLQDVDLAVVSKTYEAGASGGSVGVIGPMRMNYKRAISAVEQVSRELEDRISAEQD